MIGYDDFAKVDIRVGRIVKAEPFPEARKPAYRLWVDFGADLGVKRSSAQITKHYTIEGLVGRQVLAVVNFPPRQIGPVMSEVLVLGLPDEPARSCCWGRATRCRWAEGCSDAPAADAPPAGPGDRGRGRPFRRGAARPDRPDEPRRIARQLRDYDLILPTLGDLYRAEVFAEVPAPRTRLLANFGVGYNHIDVAAAQAAGVAVTNTPGAVTDATADIALALILMTARRLGEGERMLRAGRWTGWHPVQLLGAHVSGKTVGIIGMGRIGKAIARRCHFGFGMEVVYHNRSPVADPGVPARAVPLAQAMAADFVVVAVPGGPATRHLIGAEALGFMKETGIFVNIARGDVVDEAALVDGAARGADRRRRAGCLRVRTQGARGAGAAGKRDAAAASGHRLP
jgi:export-related chaperone CsaA